jgi:hypothetical protein
MTLETCDLVIDGSCRLSDVDLPPNSNIFTVQAHGFVYGGTTKQSHLPHCYELPCNDMVHMKHYGGETVGGTGCNIIKD